MAIWMKSLKKIPNRAGMNPSQTPYSQQKNKPIQLPVETELQSARIALGCFVLMANFIMVIQRGSLGSGKEPVAYKGCGSPIFNQLIKFRADEVVWSRIVHLELHREPCKCLRELSRGSSTW